MIESRQLIEALRRPRILNACIYAKKIMVDDVAFQLILCKLLFNPSFYMQRTHTISFHIYIYLYYHHHISYLFLKKLYTQNYICPYPCQTKYPRYPCILHPAFSPLYLYRHAYLRVLWSTLNATSELSVHVDARPALLYLDTGKT